MTQAKFNTDGSWAASVCDRLRKLRVERVNTKAKLTEAIDLRKSLEDTIKELGKEKTEARMEADHNYVEVLGRIEYHRTRLKWLADEIESSIDRADKGELFEAVDLDKEFEATLFDEEGIGRAAPTELSSFRRFSAAKIAAAKGKEHQWLDVPFESLTEDPVQKGYARTLAAFGAGTPAAFLAFVDEAFEYRMEIVKIIDHVSGLSEPAIRFAGEIVGQRLYATGTETVYDVLDSMTARNAEAFADMFGGTRMADVAAFPADQRFGRELPAEGEKKPRGKKAATK